ncbi:MAG: ankyrin repeat domain-containing protein, partial [Actinobacteria bacterium]|nr:ankyrin repeat domain-containing protein [Actinomycetota bacterium]
MDASNESDTLFLAIRFGHTDQLREMLAANPALASAPLGGRYQTRAPLDIVTDWPGYFPNGPEIVRLLVAAGADPDGEHPDGRSPGDETPLHWAASSDDVDVAEALIDAGADIEAPDGSIGTPLDNAIGYCCWNVARLLVARGAKVDKLWHAAALGMLDRLQQLLDGQPTADEISQAFWHACSGAQRRAAELLLGRGADLGWVPDYAYGTPLDAAMGDGTRRENVITWLREQGAETASDRDMRAIAIRIETAFANRDLEAFGTLLAEDARWGDDDAVNKCRSRA